MDERSTGRVDNFTDAAFAFAVTLLVVGAGGAPADGDALEAAVAAIPSFAIGFALIALFWFSHVRWRALRGTGDARSLLLTLLLVFAVLVYIVPLRAMSVSFAAFLTGGGQGFAGGLGRLFTVYGLGFTLMSALTAALFRDCLRNPALSDAERRSAIGQAWIWAILTLTGVASTALALIPATAPLAPFLYATLPLTIGAFASRWRWE